MSVLEDKTSMRAEMKEHIKSIQRRDRRSYELLEEILKRDVFENVNKVSVFVPLPDEINTRLIAEYCWESGLDIYVPEHLKGSDVNIIKMRRWMKRDKLKLRNFGVPHPQNDEIINLNEIDLVFVPGLAFGYDGRRLGRGKGFYDQLLSVFARKKLGICFEEQIRENIPWEDHDQRVGMVITC